MKTTQNLTRLCLLCAAVLQAATSGAQPVTKIAAGTVHSLFLKSDGSLTPPDPEELTWAVPATTTGLTATENSRFPQETAPWWYQEDSPQPQNPCGGSGGVSLWGMGSSQYGQLGDGTYNWTNRPKQILAGSPGYNRISGQLLSGGNVGLSFVGMAGTNYALDRCFSLTQANWVPQVTNSACLGGALMFTNTPKHATNNFWRVRSVP